MTAFSREESKQTAIDIKIRRAKCQAKSGQSTMKLKHPNWCKDASADNYTILIKEVTEQCKKKQLLVQKFREKLHHVDK